MSTFAGRTAVHLQDVKREYALEDMTKHLLDELRLANKYHSISIGEELKIDDIEDN